MLGILINHDENKASWNSDYKLIRDSVLASLGITHFNTYHSLEEYLDDSKFISGYPKDKTHIVLNMRDLPYMIEPVVIPKLYSGHLMILQNEYSKSKIIVGIRDSIKRYCDGEIVIPKVIDSISIDTDSPECLTEFNMYNIIKNSDHNSERLNGIVRLSKRSCSMMEDTSLINLMHMISGMDKTEILNVLQTLNQAVSISVLEKIHDYTADLQESLEDIIVEVPNLGVAYINEDNILVSNLGKLDLDELKASLNLSAEEALNRSIMRAKAKLITSDTAFPKKVRL